MRIVLFTIAIVCGFIRNGLAECQGRYDKKIGKTIYETVDKMPSSEIDIPAFFAKNMQCANCREEEYQSRYIIAFVVNENGTVTDVKVNGKSEKAMSSWEMAVYDTFRQCRSAWTPGVCSGKVVAVKMFIPITICL